MQRVALILFLSILISCDPTKVKTPEPVIIEAPKSKPSQIDPLDSSYLRIKVSPSGYEIVLFEKHLKSSKIESLDSFLFANEDRINKSKVIVVSNDSLYNFSQVKATLIKHDIPKIVLKNE